MTFLELVNRTRQECGVSRNDLLTLNAVTGESLRIKNWVIQAWKEIQQKGRNLDWMTRDFSFQTIAAQQAYTATDAVPTGIALTSFKRWKQNTFRIYLTATGASDETHLTEMAYEDFRNYYIFGSMRTTQGRPSRVAIRAQDKALLLGMVPDAVYTVVGQYFIQPVALSADADEPAWIHDDMAIVYKAMEFYGYYEAAPEVLSRGKAEFKTLMGGILNEELPDVELAGPLL